MVTIGRSAPAAPARQLGAVAVWVGVSLVAFLVFIGIAIDLGNLYLTQRELQRTANLAALDATRLASGCHGEVVDPLSAAQNEVLASVLRNGGRAEWVDPGRVQLGRRSLENGLQVFRPIGQPVQTEDGVTVPGTAGNRNAVEVSLQRPVPARIFPLFVGANEGSLRATAAAWIEPTATVTIGSSLAELDPELLSDFLSDALNADIDLISYQGLAAANVTLGELLEVSESVGSVEDLLDSQMPLPGLIDNLLRTTGDGINDAARVALQQLADSVDQGIAVVPREVIDIAPGSEEAARGAVINVGALLLGAAQAANGENLANLPIDVDIGGGLVDVDGGVRIIEPLRQEILTPDNETETAATTAQGVIDLTATATVGPVRLRLPLFVNVARATATLASLSCASRDVPLHTAIVNARGGVAQVGLGELTNPGASDPVVVDAPIAEVDLLGTTILLCGSSLTSIQPSAPTSLRFEGLVFPSDPQSVETLPGDGLSSAVLSLGSLTLTPRLGSCSGASPAAPLLVLLQPLLQNSVLPLIASTLSGLDQQALEPLLGLLGLKLGTADVTVVAVQVDNPTLFTR
ncbi:MAG TPA: pilus assembly protein TadG-related protein [Nevskiaceae bacterium]|nr:pilus assembly protein TadG-related protein [Nevskiaceae bacterium]